MNLDGKAFVKNTTNRMFISSNGSANVIDKLSKQILFIPERHNDSSYVFPVNYTHEKEMYSTVTKVSKTNLIPYTVQVYTPKEKCHSLNGYTFNGIISKIVNKGQSFSYNYNEAHVSKVQPTNIKYNPKSAIVIDSSIKELQTPFSSVSVNVNSKLEVVVPEKGTDYTDISMVVQKNSFIEFKLSDSVTNVINLPESLTYLPGYIKGIFTQSGEYNIKIKYPDGEQILNIIVPYYKRLL